MNLILAGPGKLLGDYDILISSTHNTSAICHTTSAQVAIIKKELFY